MRYTDYPLFGIYPWECIGGQWSTASDDAAADCGVMIPNGLTVLPGPFTIPHTGLWHFRWSAYVAPQSGAGAISVYMAPMFGTAAANFAPDKRAVATLPVGNGAMIGHESQVVVSKGTIIYLGMAVLSGVVRSYNRQLSMAACAYRARLGESWQTNRSRHTSRSPSVGAR